MKSKLIQLCLIFNFVFNYSFAFAPRISYTIPDIGYLGMGIYIEVISPHDAYGNFGPDTFLINNNGRIRIVFDRPEDSSKIIVGPISVSWHGRLLSTYFFINPFFEEPNSSDWTLLDSKFRVPFRVMVDGNYSNADTFYIVKPYNFGNLLQTNQVFGTGPLGRRSPSGAILVENLNLGSLEYRAFLDNTLSFPASNRTYLPFIVLSTGDVTGFGTSTKINVSAGTGRLQNAGPGGGGGGGRFCDNITGNPGEDGGNGFTSGGKGGVNYFLSGSGAYKSLGCGTGDSGRSLNGVPPAVNPGGWEASGGGTGHPFGKSGVGSGDQSNWNVSGGYGGGTGSINNRMGGSGGYATDGRSEPSNYNNGGKIHGNPMIIPVAGGSGGASGNPSGLNVCSGSGGGGGGAIRIFGKRVENLSIIANGANGGQSSYGAGGGGSGGSISVCAKEVAQGLSLSALGGNGGGAGYFRLDAPDFSTISFSHSNPPVYVGLSTDTTTYVKRKFTITGSKNPSSDVIGIYIKSEFSDWQLLKNVTGFPGQDKWSTEIILPDSSKIFYLCAVQDLNNYDVDTFKYQPRFLLSQAAMNTLRRIPQGICLATREFSLVAYNCPGNVVFDSGIVKNIGDGNLTVKFSRARFKNSFGFEIVAPQNDIVLLPNDSVKFFIRFVANKTISEKYLVDTLLIEHSDDEWSSNPWSIIVRLQLLPYSFDFYAIDKSRTIDTINLGDICNNLKLDTTFLLINQSQFPINFYYKFNSSNISLGSSESYLSPNFEDTINLALKPNFYGRFIDSLIVYPVDCPELKKVLYITYNNIYTSTEFVYKNTKVDTINLGEICVGDTFELIFYLQNKSNSPIKLIDFEANWSRNIQPLIPLNTIIEEQHGVENNVILTPTAEGKYVLTLVYYFDKCEHKDTIVIIYNVVKSNSVVLTGTYFGFVSIGESDTTTVVIVNNGSGTTYFDKEPPSAPNFRFLGSVPEIPTYLRPGDTLRLVYEFTPDKEGEFTHFVEFFSNSVNDCPDTIRFELRGFGTNAKIFANVDSVFFGLLPYCKSKDTIIYVSNKGSTDLKIKKVEILQSYSPEHFFLSNSFSQSFIPPGAIDSCAVKFVGVRGAPSGLKTAVLLIESNDVNNPQIQIKLSAIQENLNVDLVPDTIDFGTCQIGDFKTQKLKLINNGLYPEPQRIRDFEGNKLVFEPNPNVAIIRPNDSVEIVFTFRPDQEGEIFDSMRIVYYQPCPDTQWVYLKGNAVSGNFFVTDTLDFGDVVICGLDTLIFSITNLGTIPFRVDSAKIFGQDAINFKILDKFPKTIDTIGKFTIIFEDADSERVYTAFLKLFIFINNTTEQATILLRANPRRFIKFEVPEIDFGFVPIGLTKEIVTRIVNFGMQVTISEHFFVSSSNIFSTSLPNNLLVLANSKQEFSVYFIPNSEGPVYDTLIAVVNYPECSDSIKLVLKGFGVPPQDVIIRAGDVQLNPKDEVGTLPIYISLLDKEKSLTVNQLQLKVSFIWNVFHPTSLSKGKILSQKISGGIRELILDFDSLVVDGNEKMLTSIIGIPLISDTDFSTVNIYEPFWLPVGLVKNTILDSGSIAIMVCTEGGKRLVRPTTSSLINVINDERGIIIKFELTEPKSYVVRLTNLLGKVLFEEMVYSDGLNRREVLIQNVEYGSTLLLLQIFNHTEIHLFKLIHVK